MIKVERPVSGDFARAYDSRVKGLASHFVWTNRSKESLTLDLKHADAGEVVGRLLAKADVLVQNLAPGAAARMGLSFEALHETYPRLVVCDISGYGDDPERPGPYRDKKAYDLLIQSESGFLSITGTPDEPAKAGCSIADIAAGMYAYSGILAALIERGRTGKGRRVDVSMLESMVEWMSYPLYYAFDGAAPPPRTGAAHATIYPYGPFPGRRRQDGDARPAERARVGRLLPLRARAAGARDRSALRLERGAHRGARGAARDHRRRLRDASPPRRSKRASTRRRSPTRASTRWPTSGPIRSSQARARWVDVATPSGAVPALLPPAARDGDDARMDAVPALGAHTDALLAEIGLDAGRDRAPASRRRDLSACAMAARPALVFACAHLCDERLFAAQRDALAPDHDCRASSSASDDSLAAMAEALLAAAPAALHAGRPVARRLRRVRGRAPRAASRSSAWRCSTRRPRPTRAARRAGRLADIAKVEAGGIEALIPELPARWLLPAHAARADLVALMAAMARSVGASGQRNQQRAMLGRPDSLADLAPFACRRWCCAASRIRSRRSPTTRRSPRGSPARASSGSPTAATCRRSSSPKR